MGSCYFINSLLILGCPFKILLALLLHGITPNLSLEDGGKVSIEFIDVEELPCDLE